MPNRLQRLKASVCLLAYFLVWMESAHALPLLFVAADDSHKAIVTEYRGRIHLTLHHPGNKDKHELLAEDQSSMPTIVASGPDKHSDHEISVLGGEQFISPMAKKVEATKNILPGKQLTPAFVNNAPTGRPSNYTSKTAALSVSPVLLI